MTISTDITIAYLLQGSFYGHSIYASLYMDVWRRDSVVMVTHHVVTLVLITFSYAFRSATFQEELFKGALKFHQCLKDSVQRARIKL